MKSLASLTAMLVCALGLNGCQKAEFKEFSSKEGRFTAQFPGTPKESTQTAMGVTLHNVSLEEKRGAYAVSYADMPIPAKETAAQTESRLDGAQEGMVKNVNGTSMKSTKITMDGKIPGRSVEANLPVQDGVLRAKIFIVNGRLYQVLVTGKKDWANSAEATKFLDSFSISK